MKDKPTESQLIAYLYGELSASERKEMEKYLKTHPEVQAEMEELGMTRDMLGKLQDREVAEPTLIVHHADSVLSKFSRTWLGIAATLLILILAGFATGLQVQVNNEGFNLAFGQTNSEATFSSKEVEQMMAAAMLKVNDQLDERLTNFQNGINSNLVAYQDKNDKKIDEAYANLLEVNKTQISNFVDQMDRQQKTEIENLFAMSQEQQQLYLGTILTDFTTYLDRQRSADLENIETYLTGYKENADQRLMQTEQLIATIISQVNNSQISD